MNGHNNVLAALACIERMWPQNSSPGYCSGGTGGHLSRLHCPCCAAITTLFLRRDYESGETTLAHLPLFPILPSSFLPEKRWTPWASCTALRLCQTPVIYPQEILIWCSCNILNEKRKCICIVVILEVKYLKDWFPSVIIHLSCYFVHVKVHVKCGVHILKVEWGVNMQGGACLCVYVYVCAHVHL